MMHTILDNSNKGDLMVMEYKEILQELLHILNGEMVFLMVLDLKTFKMVANMLVSSKKVSVMDMESPH